MDGWRVRQRTHERKNCNFFLILILMDHCFRIWDLLKKFLDSSALSLIMPKTYEP